MVGSTCSSNINTVLTEEQTRNENYMYIDLYICYEILVHFKKKQQYLITIDGKHNKRLLCQNYRDYRDGVAEVQKNTYIIDVS